MSQETGSDELEVVFVCTGNVFRSAIAEAALRGRSVDLPVRTSSAGTLDLQGAPAHAAAVELGLASGFDLSAHRSRWLGGLDLSGSDLVIGFERAHVAAAVVDSGSDRSRTFTLPELVELLERAGPIQTRGVEGARAAVRRVGQLRTSSSGFPEIRDPIGGPPSVFTETGNSVVELVARLMNQLFPRG